MRAVVLVLATVFAVAVALPAEPVPIKAVAWIPFPEARPLDWGKALTSYDGETVYSNGPKPTYVDPERTATGIPGQCVELVQRYFARKWGIKKNWHADAADMYDRAPDGVEPHPNGTGSVPPKPGDALVFDKIPGKWDVGHVALITKVTPTRIYFVQQNVHGKEEDSLPIDGNTIRTGSFYPPVRGWLHAKANTEAPAPDAETIPVDNPGSGPTPQQGPTKPRFVCLGGSACNPNVVQPPVKKVTPSKPPAKKQTPTKTKKESSSSKRDDPPRHEEKTSKKRDEPYTCGGTEGENDEPCPVEGQEKHTKKKKTKEDLSPSDRERCEDGKLGNSGIEGCTSNR